MFVSTNITATEMGLNKPQRCNMSQRRNMSVGIYNTTTASKRQREMKENERKRTENLTNEPGKLNVYQVIRGMNKDYYSVSDIENHIEAYDDALISIDEHVSYLIIMKYL